MYFRLAHSKRKRPMKQNKNKKLKKDKLKREQVMFTALNNNLNNNNAMP